MSNLAQRVLDFQKQQWSLGHPRISGEWYHTVFLKAEVNKLTDAEKQEMWREVGQLFRAEQIARASRIELSGAQSLEPGVVTGK